MRFLIIGAGSAGQRHFATLTALGVPGGSIAVHDVATIPLEKFPGASVYQEKKLGEVLKAVSTSERTAAIVCTPPVSHLTIAAECVARGMHVLIEKPIVAIGANSANAAHHVTQLDLAARASGLTAMVGYPYRYSNGFQRLLGQVRDAEDTYSAYSYYGNIGAAHNSEHILSRVTVHQVNYMRALLRHIGAPVGSELSGTEPEVTYTAKDAGMILETHLCPGFISSNVVSAIRSHHVTVETSNGTLTWDDSMDNTNQMNKTMLSHFITCCEFGTPPDTGLHDALIDVRLLKVKV